MFRKLCKLFLVFSMVFMLFNLSTPEVTYATTGITVTSLKADVGDMAGIPTFTLTGVNLPTLTGAVSGPLGVDYKNFLIVERSNGFTYGDANLSDSEGINVVSSSSTQLVFQMGDNYGPNGYNTHYTGILDFYLAPANSNVQQNSSNFVGSINLSTVLPGMTVSSITSDSGDMYNKPTFTLTGTNLPTLKVGVNGPYGVDYKNFLMVEHSNGFTYGDSGDSDTVGINVISSTSTQLVFQMGGTYGPNGYGTHYTGILDFYLSPYTTLVQQNVSCYVGSLDLSAISSSVSGSDATAQLQTLDPNETDLQSLAADPINTATGAHEISRHFLALTGEQPLSLQLNYNSLLLKQGSMGVGWGHNFETRLESLSNGNVIIHWTANRQNTYVKNSSGQYVPQDSAVLYDNLIHNADGSYTLMSRDQSVYQFSSSGQLVQQNNGHGQSFTLSYDTNGHLISVSEPISGRSLNFTYNSSGLISSVSDNSNRQVSFMYDANNNLNTITDENGKQTTYTYDSNGRVLTESDAEGVTLFTNTFDSKGRVISQSDAVTGHQPTQFSYDESSHPGTVITTVTDRNGKSHVLTHNSGYELVALQDELGNTTTFTYDSNGNRTSVTDAKGNVTSYAYDSKGNLLYLTDPNSNSTSMTYDSNNNLLSVTTALGKTTNYTYDSNNNKTSVTDSLGNKTSFTYDTNGQLSSKTTPGSGTTTYAYQNGMLQTVTDPDGVISSYSYDQAGRPITVTNGGQTTSYTYDAIGNILSQADGLGSTITYTYDSHADKLTQTDAKGNVTQYSYDNNGKLLSQMDSLQHLTHYQYDNEDRLLKVIDAKNNATTFNRDAKGRITSVTDPLGNTVQTQYDPVDNVTGTQDALGIQTKTITYDANNNAVTVKDALGNTITNQYDALNRLIQTTDPLGNHTQFNYDDVNRMTSSVDALNDSSKQSFDADGNRTTIVDPNNNQTSFTFDHAQRLTVVTNASGNVISYQYNNNGQLSQMTNGRGETTTYQYDAAGRVITFTDPTGTVSYTYDANGNVLTTSDNVGTESREYDSLNRLVKYTDVYGNVLQYTYDEVGNLTSITYPDGKIVNYVYDSAKHLTQVKDWNGNLTQYTYDVNGRLTTTTRPDGSKETKTYNAAGQLVQATDVAADGATISETHDTYDAGNRVTSEQNNLTNRTQNLTNDSLGQLLQDNVTDTSGSSVGQYQFTYDKAGNLLTNTSSNPSTSDSITYTTDNRIATFNGITVSYDADGNMTTGPLGGSMQTFAYDARNRLTSVGGVSYTYDADNHRVGITQGATTTRYIVNPNAALSQVLMETDGAGTPTAYYVYGLGLISRTDANSNTIYYHYDRRGSTVALTDASGHVTDTYDYSPYGSITQHTGNTSTAFLFNGRDGVMTDGNGLYYMRARYYDPQLLRFINADVKQGSVEQGLTLNRYAYVNGQPISYVDPFGLSRDGDQSLDYLQMGLNIAGLIPGLNIPANALNAIISGIRGDWVGAGVYTVGIIPGLSDLIDFGKLGDAALQFWKDESGSLRIGKEMGTLPDDTLVVRGGQSSPENLSTNQSKDPRGHISANVGSNLDTLATTPKPFPNGSISVTTAGDIRSLGKGWDVVPDPTANNPYHGSIVPPESPMSPESANALSQLFDITNNKWR